MFEAAELGHKLAKDDYESQLPELRDQLIQTQLALKEKETPVVLLISGIDGAGKGELVHRLNEWLDPRGIDTHAFWRTSNEEDERPNFWRYWRRLPGRGRIAILFGSWYTNPIVRRLSRESGKAEFESALKRIASFEKMLVDDGTLLIKLWLHLPRRVQVERRGDLRRHPELHWRVLPADLTSEKSYNAFIKASETAIRRTDSASAPWLVIEASDARYRDVTAARTLLDRARDRLTPSKTDPPSQEKPPESPVLSTAGPVTILDNVPLERSLGNKEYRSQLSRSQHKLRQLAWQACEQGKSAVIVFEGWDAAGKGSCIRRVTEALDPRLYRVKSVTAPDRDERAHPWLWRFWRELPRAGMITIFDRSWYGRVLVERVEGFAQREEWLRAYREINEFEEQLIEHGLVVAKFWLHISKKEQLDRFKKRERVAYKRYKITEEDWRNRAKWNDYKKAVNDMVARTSTVDAPWTLIPADDKKFARVEVLRTVCRALRKKL